MGTHSEANKADILIITVNDHERAAISKAFSVLGTPRQFQGQDLEPYTSYGVINGQHVVHAKAMMGSTLSGASRDTCFKAIADLSPQLIAAGICWGGREDHGQNIGDILISHKVQLGSNSKIMESRIELRGPKAEINATIIKILESARDNFLSSQKTHKGIILSKEELFDNKALRDSYVKEAGIIGGEMEGQGIYSAINDSSQKPVWVIVKAICDWGYAKNFDPRKKERDQKKAAKNAATLCAKAIENYKLVETPFSPTIESSIPALPDLPANNSAEHNSLVVGQENFHSFDSATSFLNELDNQLSLEIYPIHTQQANAVSKIVYWPVRLREPNIVHAAQTFIAAGLAKYGMNIHLCFDDLGKIDGFSDAKSASETFIFKIKSWITRVCDDGIAENIINRITYFSDYVGDESRGKPPQPNTLDLLGENLLRWLVAKDHLRQVLRESKLIKEDSDVTAALIRKPRRILTPPLVWTTMLAVDKTSNLYTLGGEDERLIWMAFANLKSQQRNITSILLPYLTIPPDGTGGDKAIMDSRVLRAGSVSEIKAILDGNGKEITEWFVKFGWHLPELIQGKGTTLQHKLSSSNIDIARAVFDYFKT